MEEGSGDNSEVVGCRDGRDGHETLRGDKKEKDDRTSHGDSKRHADRQDYRLKESSLKRS
jgi:hypothetical protein